MQKMARSRFEQLIRTIQLRAGLALKGRYSRPHQWATQFCWLNMNELPSLRIQPGARGSDGTYMVCFEHSTGIGYARLPRGTYVVCLWSETPDTRDIYLPRRPTSPHAIEK